MCLSILQKLLGAFIQCAFQRPGALHEKANKKKEKLLRAKLSRARQIEMSVTQ